MASNMHNMSIPADLQEILVKLKFLAMIQRGTKVNVNSMNFVRADSLLGALFRAYNHENRRTTYQFVKEIVDLSIDAIGKYNHPILLDRLIKGLNSARLGVRELASTYHDDPEMVSRMGVILDKIDLQLKKHEHILAPIESTTESPTEPKDELVDDVIATRPTASVGATDPIETTDC